MLVPPSALRPPFSTYRMLRHSGEIYGYFTKWLNALPDYGWLAREVDVADAAGKEKEKRPATATVVTISSIGYRQPPQTISLSLSLSVFLSLRSFSGYDHRALEKSFFPLLPPLPSSFPFFHSHVLSFFHYAILRCSRLHSREVLRVLSHRPAWSAAPSHHRSTGSPSLSIISRGNYTENGGIPSVEES